MLAAKLNEGDLPNLRFPLLASPKLDGIRCLTTKQGAVSRNLKPIPNVELRGALSALPPGLDGELVIPDANFSDVSSVVMSRDADCKLVEFWVFDTFTNPPIHFAMRSRLVRDVVKSLRLGWVRDVPQTEVKSLEAALQLEEQFLKDGYEGIMLRCHNAAYKFGRSTVREQGLMKLKRFEDSEAVVTGCVEMLHNENEAKPDALGRSKRSSKKAGKVAAGVLGALTLRDVKTGVDFDLGAGFTDSQRRVYWRGRHLLVGLIAKYKHQKSGAKERPRFPVFLGFRAKGDL